MSLGPMSLEGLADIFHANMEYFPRAMNLTFPSKPKWATANRVALDAETVRLREFSTGLDGIPGLIVAPYSGYTSNIADFATGQSMVQAYQGAGYGSVFVTDWKPATRAMRDLGMDEYLADLVMLIAYLGGRVHLVGMCQGAMMVSMIAALYPDMVASLVIAGGAIDTSAGDSELAKVARETPMSKFEELVKTGGGLMRGEYLLNAWKVMYPGHFIAKYFEMYRNLLDNATDKLEASETFTSWNETMVDLPGRLYLDMIDRIFKQNLLFKGEFVALGRTVSLGDITCPVWLLAAAKDDITPSDQVFNAEQVLTGSSQVTKTLIPGGHLGLFLGKSSTNKTWPSVAKQQLEY